THNPVGASTLAMDVNDNGGYQAARVAHASIASTLAMDVNDNAGCQAARVAHASIASRLAPTEDLTT
ncbi:hypothetical protein ACQKP5_19760, partial [Pseudomonas vancouverensis]